MNTYLRTGKGRCDGQRRTTWMGHGPASVEGGPMHPTTTLSRTYPRRYVHVQIYTASLVSTELIHHASMRGIRPNGNQTTKRSARGSFGYWRVPSTDRVPGTVYHSAPIDRAESVGARTCTCLASAARKREDCDYIMPYRSELYDYHRPTGSPVVTSQCDKPTLLAQSQENCSTACKTKTT